MDKVYEELDEAKALIERLRAECRVKADLSENLKRAHSEQLIKLQELSLKLEKQAQELNEKADESSISKQMYEELKINLKEKVAILKCLSSANDKLHVECGEKLQKYEEKKKELACSLGEANAKNMDQDRKICKLMDEIESLKENMSVSNRKNSEAAKMAKASKEMRQRDDVVLKLEEENRKVEDQLKWKREQFKHLEEAHEKLRDQLQARDKEWEKEKSLLFDEISKLQTDLDSQTRLSEGLQSRLQMCNQALAHEETRRKYLEVQLSESKRLFDGVSADFDDAKSTIEFLTGQRDKEIASLRDLLGTKETLHKEMEYRVGKLEQENKELMVHLRELQEAQIQEARTSSTLSQLRNKLKVLEQKHRDCSTTLKAKEANSSSQIEKLTRDLNCCRSELESKDSDMKELEMELEGCHSYIEQLTLQQQESSVMLLVLKSGFLEAQLKFSDKVAEMNLKNNESEENLSLLMNQLEEKKSALFKAQMDIEEELNKVASLSVDVESLNSNKELNFLLRNELQRHKEMLEESSECQLRLKEQMLRMKDDLNQKESGENLSLLMKQLEEKKVALLNAQTDIEDERKKVALLSMHVESLNFNKEQFLLLQEELQRHKEMLKESSECQLHLKEQVMRMKSDLKQVCDALDEANDELAEKFYEGNEVEFELQLWKSIAERLKTNLEENHQMRKEIEASLLSQVEVEFNLNQEKERLIHVSEEKNRRIDDLEQQLVLLEQELKTREAKTATPTKTKMATTRVSEKDSLGQCAKKKGKMSEDIIQKEIEWFEHEWVRRELEEAIFAQIDAERTHEQEKESLHQLVEEKDERIEDLQQILRLLEQEFENSTASFSSRLSEMQEEINLLHKAWESMSTVEIIKEIEIEEKNLMIVELENDLNSSKEKMFDIEAELKAKQLEAKKLTIQIETQLRSSEAVINKLNDEKRNLVEEVMNLSSEREKLLGTMEGLYEGVSSCCSDDVQLTRTLGKMMKNFDKNETEIERKGYDEEYFDPIKENMSSYPFHTTKNVEAIVDERSPLRALNN